MKHSEKILQYITEQLAEQGFEFSVLSMEEVQLVERQWCDKFITGVNRKELGNLKWHAFSYRKLSAAEGQEAISNYLKQYPADCYIFNEQLSYGIKCNKADKLPDVMMEDFRDDIYICHYNMKWTYIITHEMHDFGPYFTFSAII